MYDKSKDLMPVDQIGFLDLREAFVSGSISGDFNISDEAYNNASPEDMMHRPDDLFAGYRQRDFVKGALAAQSKTDAVTE